MSMTQQHKDAFCLISRLKKTHQRRRGGINIRSGIKIAVENEPKCFSLLEIV